MMKVSRKENWQELLHAFMLDCDGMEFVRGKHDCIMFAANAVRSITGVDMAESIRGKYSTRQSAIRVLQSGLGFPTILEAVDHLCAAHGIGEVPMLFAMPGDIVIGESRDLGHACGIAWRDRAVTVSRAHRGLTAMAKPIKAWRVPSWS
jgi:hypothetical protein